MEDINRILDVLKQQKLADKVTYKEISDKTGISVKTVSGLFTGTKYDTKISTIIAVANALNLELTVKRKEIDDAINSML